MATAIQPNEKENLQPIQNTQIPASKEEQKESKPVTETKKTEEKSSKPDNLIVIGADVGKGKLQKKFEKFRNLRIVFLHHESTHEKGTNQSSKKA